MADPKGKDSDEKVLRDAGYVPGDKYDKVDAMQGTNSSGKEVSEAWHQAREDARASGELTDRPATSPTEKSTNEPNPAEYGDLFTRLTGQ